MSFLPRALRPLTGLFLLCSLLDGTRLARPQAPMPMTMTTAPAPFAAPVRLHPEDSPDEAQEYYRAKRAPVGEKALPVERYIAALEEMRRMPQHSIARDAFLPSRAELEDKGLSYVFDAASLGGWSPLGPGNVGGRTRTLVIDPRNPDVMYAGGVAGGVWKTTDGGGSWTPLADLMANLAIGSLAMDPANSRVLYAGTGEVYAGNGVRGAGIFKSTDAGGHWTRLAKTQTPDFYFVNDIVVSPKSSARVYAATFTGVWRSTNGGTSWKRLLAPSGAQGCTDLAIRTDRADDFLFAACGITRSAVYRNEKAQGTGKWALVLSEPEMSRTSLAIAPSNQDVIYALASSNDSGPSFADGEDFFEGLHAVFRSDRGGVPGSWSAQVRNTDPVKLNRLLLSNPVQSSLRDCGFAPTDDMYSQGWYDNAIAVDPTDPDRVWVGGIDLFRSDDGGRSWGLASYWWGDQPPGAPSFAHADQHSIVFHPRYDGAGNRTLYATSDGGIFRTNDAQAATGSSANAVCSPLRTSMRWTSLNHGYGVTQFYHGAPFPGGSRYLGGTQDNGTVLGGDGQGPDGWRRVLGGDGGYVAIDPSFPDIVYAEYYRLSLQISLDGGLRWTPATNGVSGPFPFIAPFVMDPNRSSRLWLGGGSLWRTDDRAVTWTRASISLTGSHGLVSAVTVARADSDRVLAGTERGSILRNDGGLAADGQTEWPAARPRDGWVSSVTFDPDDPEVAYATYSTFGGTHVWKSTDGGATWRGIDGTGTRKIPDIPVHVLVVDPHQPSHLFVGTDLGVFVSADGGATWAVENTGFANVTTEWLTVLESSGGPSTLYAFTHGRGAWKVAIRE